MQLLTWVGSPNCSLMFLCSVLDSTYLGSPLNNIAVSVVDLFIVHMPSPS